MKMSAEYANKFKKWWQKHKKAVADFTEHDPLAVLIVALLSKNATVEKAVEALGRIKREMVDFNELRVTPEPEIGELLGKRFPDALDRAGNLCKALGYLFEREHVVTLDKIAQAARKDQRSYLAHIPGLDAYSVGVVLLHAFDHHCVPMDDDVLAAMQHEGILPRDAELEEINLWLERQIPKQEAHAFWVLSKRWLVGELLNGESAKPHREAPPEELDSDEEESSSESKSHSHKKKKDKKKKKEDKKKKKKD